MTNEIIKVSDLQLKLWNKNNNKNTDEYIIYAPSDGVALNAFTVLSITTCASLPESRIVF
ncbi:hypothetical protein D3C86_1334970 [compost metagenome]